MNKRERGEAIGHAVLEVFDNAKFDRLNISFWSMLGNAAVARAYEIDGVWDLVKAADELINMSYECESYDEAEDILRAAIARVREARGI